MSKKYKWNLDYLYKSNAEFKKDIKNLEVILKKVLQLKGKLNNKNNYLSLIELEEKQEILETKIYLYSNIYSLDQTNIEFIRVLKEVEVLNNKYTPLMAWLGPELDSLNKKDVLNWVKDSKFKHYKFSVNEFYRLKKHRLSKHDSELLAKVSKSNGAAAEIYSELTVSDNSLPVLKVNDKEIKLTLKKFLEIMKESNPKKDQNLRKEALEIYYKKYYENKFTFSKIYQKFLEEATDFAKLKKHKSYLAAKLNYNKIPLEVYQKLLEVSKKNSNLVTEKNRDFKDFLIKKYKLKNVFVSDAQIDILKSKHKYNADQALEIIEKVTKKVGSEYHEAFLAVSKDGYIDYFESENKVKGAYSTGNTIYNPLILMNYTDDVDSLLTLAHELGHSIHTYLSNKYQEQVYQSYSIYLAEIASTTLEFLVIDYLTQNEKIEEEKIYLINKKLETQIATFFRQAQFADFEHEVIESVFNGKIYDHEEFKNLFNAKSIEHGSSKVFEKYNPELDYSWARISHFFSSPYYVYQYATCIAATYNLISKIKSGETKTFLNILKAGSSKLPNEILIRNNIDLTLDSTYKPLLKDISLNLKELKKFYNK